MSYFLKDTDGNNWSSINASINGTFNGTVEFNRINSQITEIRYKLPNYLANACTYAQNYSYQLDVGVNEDGPCGTKGNAEGLISVGTQNTNCGSPGGCVKTGNSSFIELVPKKYSQVYNYYHQVWINNSTGAVLLNGFGIFWDGMETGGGPPGSPTMIVTVTAPYVPTINSQWYVNLGPINAEIKQLSGSINITVPSI